MKIKLPSTYYFGSDSHLEQPSGQNHRKSYVRMYFWQYGIVFWVPN